MDVLVTGATGFLGGWVTRALVATGHSVRVLLRRPARDSGLHGLGAVVFQGDVLAPDSLQPAMSGVDAVIHCAGSVSRRLRDKDSVYRVNVEGTRNVLEAAARRHVKVVHTSSIACVGPSPDPRLLDEDTPGASLGFEFPYVESKRRSEELALSYAANGRTEVIVLNPGSVMGPGDPSYGSTELVLRYLRGELRVFTQGGMSFCDARDVAKAYVTAVERGISGERYILAGVNRTYREVHEDLQRLTGLHHCFPVPTGVAEWAALWSEIGSVFWPHPFENLNQSVVRWGSLFHYCSSDKAQRELGYEIRNFESTLVDTIVDQLQRGSVAANTAELRAMLDPMRASQSRRRTPQTPATR